MASRLVYGMSKERVMPGFLSGVHKGRQTPLTAILFVTALAIVLASTGDLGDLADTTVVLLLGVFIVVNLSVLMLRSDKVSHDHFRVPLAIPVFGALACAVVMTQPTGETYSRAGMLMLLGLILWVPSYLIARREAAADRG
jgi:amino acid transporter